MSEAAVALNARINRVHVGFTRIDPLSAPPPECDVILAGDVCYEQTMGTRMMEWLRAAASRGTRVLIGDPGRRYLPPGLQHVASYRVRTTLELENAAVKETSVFTIPSAPAATGGEPR